MLEFRTQSSKLCKLFPKDIVHDHGWQSFITKWFMIQKIYSKAYTTLSANTHHDVTFFEVNGTA